MSPIYSATVETPVYRQTITAPVYAAQVETPVYSSSPIPVRIPGVFGLDTFGTGKFGGGA